MRIGLDHATGTVFVQGKAVADFELKEERQEERLESGKRGRIHGELLIRFANADEEWARQLPRPLGGAEEGKAVTTVQVDLKFDEEGQPDVLGVQVGRPWVSAVGQPIESLWFPVAHPDL